MQYDNLALCFNDHNILDEQVMLRSVFWSHLYAKEASRGPGVPSADT